MERGTGYGFDAAKDGEGLGRLLRFSSSVDDHVRRWRLALCEPAGDYSYRVDTIAAFATGRVWNHFPPRSGAASPPPVIQRAPGEHPRCGDPDFLDEETWTDEERSRGTVRRSDYPPLDRRTCVACKHPSCELGPRGANRAS